MRKLLRILVLPLLLMSSCNTDSLEDKAERYFTATLDFHRGSLVVPAGDVSGAGTASGIKDDDLVGIEIRKADKSNKVVASGMFKGSSLNVEGGNKLTVNLEHGVRYVVESSLVSGGVNKLQEGGIYSYPPFCTGQNNPALLTEPDEDGLFNWQLADFPSLSAFTGLNSLSGMNEEGTETDNKSMAGSLDMYYYNDTIKANYFNPPAIAVNLKRVSCCISPVIYNVPENHYVCGTISYGKGENKYPVKVGVFNETNQTTKVFTENCTQPKELTLNGVTFNIKYFKQDRLMVVLDSDIDKLNEEEPGEIVMCLYLKDATHKILRKMQAVIIPKYNRRYQIFADAALSGDRVVDITVKDEWGDYVHEDPFVGIDISMDDEWGVYEPEN